MVFYRLRWSWKIGAWFFWVGLLPMFSLRFTWSILKSFPLKVPFPHGPQKAPTQKLTAKNVNLIEQRWSNVQRLVEFQLPGSMVFRLSTESFFEGKFAQGEARGFYSWNVNSCVYVIYVYMHICIPLFALRTWDFAHVLEMQYEHIFSRYNFHRWNMFQRDTGYTCTIKCTIKFDILPPVMILLGCIKPYKWDKPPTSTGERKISAINSISNISETQILLPMQVSTDFFPPSWGRPWKWPEAWHPQGVRGSISIISLVTCADIDLQYDSNSCIINSTVMNVEFTLFDCCACAL